MRGIVLALLVGCGGAGAQPDKPVLADMPRPDQAALAGGVAAAAAAITLADPDGVGTAEKPDNTVEKKPIKVKENVPSSVFDRLDHPAPDAPAGDAPAKTPTKSSPAKSKAPAKTGKKANLKLPKDPLDFSTP